MLLYLQLVDRDIEIVADRGIARLIEQSEWEAICRRMEDAFRAGRFEAGRPRGHRGSERRCSRATFPRARENRDELPDRPSRRCELRESSWQLSERCSFAATVY